MSSIRDLESKKFKYTPGTFTHYFDANGNSQVLIYPISTEDSILGMIPDQVFPSDTVTSVVKSVSSDYLTYTYTYYNGATAQYSVIVSSVTGNWTWEFDQLVHLLHENGDYFLKEDGGYLELEGE